MQFHSHVHSLNSTRARRRTIESQNSTGMTERKRSFSPTHRPLLGGGEEDESVPSTPVNLEGGPVSRSHGSESQCVERERVIVSTDHDRGTGDADSGISLSSEMAGEEHSACLGGGGGNHSLRNAEKSESLLMLVVQIVIPFFFAGFGMMAAGLLLDAVQVRKSNYRINCHNISVVSEPLD